MTKEALKLALEALYPIAHNTTDDPRGQAYKAITAIKEVLAQTQEPFAYVNVEERKLEWAKPMSWSTPTTVNIPKIPLYTTPPQRTWVDLTNDEIALIHADNPHPQGFARAILAKSKEKNT